MLRPWGTRAGIKSVVAVGALMGTVFVSAGHQSARAAGVGYPRTLSGSRWGFGSLWTSGWIYVSPSGQDGGACHRTSPCASLAYATSRARPGARIIMRPGRYAPQTIHANGTRRRPIYVLAVGKVVLTRPSPASDASQTTPLLRIDASSYLHVHGLRLLGMKGRADYRPRDTTNYVGELDISGAMGSGPGIVVRRVSVLHSNLTCFKQEDDEQYELFAQVRGIDCGAPGNTQEHGIYLSGGHNTIVGSVFRGSSGYGIHCYQTSAINVNGEVIRGNWVSRAHIAGIFAGGAGERITGNTVKRNPLGIEVWGGNSLVARNIIVDTRTAISLQAQVAGSRPTTVANNTIYRGGSPNIGYGGSRRPVLRVLNNVFDGGGGAILNWSLPHGSVMDYNLYHLTVPPADKGTHSLVRDPRFISPGHNFRLRPNSPARSSGTTVRGVTVRHPASIGAR